MVVQVNYSVIEGKINAPTSKSVAQRAVAMALLCDGTSILENVTFCNDVYAAINIAENLGARIEVKDITLKIEGGLKYKTKDIFCGDSALCLRMFAPIAALLNKEIILSGSENLNKRPISVIEKPLSELMVTCNTNNGFAPVMLKGPLVSKNISIDGSITSQFLTGLLISLSFVANNCVLFVDNLVSKKYIDITINLLEKFGIRIINNNYKEFTISGNQKFKSTKINIEGDWSSCSFLLVAAAINGKVKINNLNSNSFQPDKAILEILKKTGASVKINDSKIVCKKSNLIGFEFDATDTPDLFPPLVSLAVNCKGISKIKGTHRLLYKESNRLNILIREFTKAGVKIYCSNNELVIEPSVLISNIFEPENDHRIAMAIAVAYVQSQSTCTINQAECVNKSYPGFWEHLKCLGANIKIKKP